MKYTLILEGLNALRQGKLITYYNLADLVLYWDNTLIYMYQKILITNFKDMYGYQLEEFVFPKWVSFPFFWN